MHINDQTVTGKNYDVPDPCPGRIYINKCGVKKTAILRPPDQPAQWTSQHGSVVFSQVGAEFPSCGMNECGVVVEQTSLWTTLYPDRDARPAITELQWIQYMLDTCGSVDEVLDATQQIRIAQKAQRIQYYVIDLSGVQCLLAWILGELHLHRSQPDEPFVIANDMLETSRDYERIHQGYGGTRPVTKSDMSLDRYMVTVDALRQIRAGGRIPASWFEVLDASAFAQTQWQILYHAAAGRIEYRTKANRSISAIDMQDLCFDDTLVPEYCAMENQEPQFEPVTECDNLDFLRQFFSTSSVTPRQRMQEEKIAGINAAVMRYYES
jgi:choloylglycine hydrolase